MATSPLSGLSRGYQPRIRRDRGERRTGDGGACVGGHARNRPNRASLKASRPPVDQAPEGKFRERSTAPWIHRATPARSAPRRGPPPGRTRTSRRCSSTRRSAWRSWTWRDIPSTPTPPSNASSGSRARNSPQWCSPTSPTPTTCRRTGSCSSGCSAASIDHYQLQKRYYRKDGRLIWADLAVSLVRDEAGRPVVRHRHGHRHHRAQARRRGAGRQRSALPHDPGGRPRRRRHSRRQAAGSCW